MWWKVRRPEIVELFDSEVYGRVPENAPAVKWETVETTSGTISGINVVTRRLVRHADNSSYSASGKGGSALYRRNWGERLENIADPYAYHWISGNYMKYSTNPLSSNDLPVDTHMLVALCAPRITFLSGSTPEAGDGWVDTKGTFMAGAAALPVFRLLGAKGMGTTEFPPVGIPLVDGQLAFRQHTDGHTAGSNWGFSIDLCEKYGFRTYNMRKQ